MPLALRSFMEPRFGHDFSAVWMRADSRANQLADSVKARAFTLGQSVFFNRGEYQPETTEGKRLIAHELTHVVQQGATAEPQLQRLTEAEKAENLRSSRYAGTPRLERAFDNDPALSIGESGEAVRLVQEGLVEDGLELPHSTRPDGELDGGFGEETFRAVREFQAKHGLAVDGVVGRETLAKLDGLAGAGPRPPAAEPRCPKAPTGLGFRVPEPACATDPKEDIGLKGRHFHFCLDSDVLAAESSTNVAKLASEQPEGSRFVVHGYASVEGASLPGGREYNFQLACHRANRIVRDLVDAGIPLESIETATKGPTDEFPGGPLFNRVVVVRAEPPEVKQTTRCDDPKKAEELQALFVVARSQVAEAIRRIRAHQNDPTADPVVEAQLVKHYADVDLDDLLTQFAKVAGELDLAHILICDDERKERHSRRFRRVKVCRGRSLAGAPQMRPGGRIVFCPKFWPPKDPGGMRTPLDPSRKCEYKAATIVHEAAHNAFEVAHEPGEQGPITSTGQGIDNPFSYGFFTYEVTTNVKC
jgi:outer membrane protein OmpA-like peptidoglycan-associated protein